MPGLWPLGRVEPKGVGHSLVGCHTVLFSVVRECRSSSAQFGPRESHWLPLCMPSTGERLETGWLGGRAAPFQTLRREAGCILLWFCSWSSERLSPSLRFRKGPRSEKGPRTDSTLVGMKAEMRVQGKELLVGLCFLAL